MLTDSPFSIVLADSHSLFRRELCHILEGRDEIKIVGEATDGSELFLLLEQSTPDMVILDISMPGLKGVEGVSKIKMAYPKTKILVLSMYEDKEYLQHAFSAGAEGYLRKQDTFGELMPAVETMRQGGVYVSNCPIGLLPRTRDAPHPIDI